MAKREKYPLSIDAAQQAFGNALKEAVADAEQPFRSRQAALQAKFEQCVEEERTLKQERKTLVETMRSEDINFDRLPEIDNRLAALTTLQRDIQGVKVWIATAIQNLNNSGSTVYKKIRDVSATLANIDVRLGGPTMSQVDHHDTIRHRAGLVLQAGDVLDKDSLALYHLDTPKVLAAHDDWLTALKPTTAIQEVA